MKKKIVFVLLSVFIISLFSGIVSASLYTEKIPDPSRFTLINPLWSSIMEKQDGSNITLSLIEFEWLNPNGQTSKTTMFYLNNGVDEYISDKGGFSYSQEYNYGCSDKDLYDSCVSACGNIEPERERCIEQCTEDYQCDTTIICTQNAPDDTCGLERSTSSYGSNDVVLNFDPSSGQVFGTSVLTELETILNMCFGLTETECNQYKIDFIKKVVDQYTSYHNNYDSLISQYNEDVLFIEWDNSLPDNIGSPVAGHTPNPDYPFNLQQVNNTLHDIILGEFKEAHLIGSYLVHGWSRIVGIGLTTNNESSQYNEIYTTTQEYLNFSYQEGNPILFVDAKACGSSIVWDSGNIFCCWPQTFLGSKAWMYSDIDGASYLQNNFRRYFASEGTIGKSLLKTARPDWYFHGDITSHVPYADNLTPECGWADKQGIDCICNPNETKNELAVIIKKSGIYDDANLISSINSFISSIYSDLGIMGNIQKFSGTTFEDLDLFIENLYYNSNVAYVILIGEDLPITEAVEGKIVLIGAQELGIVNNSRIIQNRNEYCYDVAISYILSPLHPPTCKDGQTKCENRILYVCVNNQWVEDKSCEKEPERIPGTFNEQELTLISQNGYLSSGRIS
tara:strand:- start:1567 stop:3429 length:1863 start_codon:yes stop_codon:yes gene_type:complete